MSQYSHAFYFKQDPGASSRFGFGGSRVVLGEPVTGPRDLLLSFLAALNAGLGLKLR